MIGNYENLILPIWTEDLKKDALSYLKELNSNHKALAHARGMVEACTKLAAVYGYFIINENMVFLTESK